MKLLDIYTALEHREIDQEQAARLLNLTMKQLKFRLTRWGHRLPLLLSVLDKIKEDRITRDEAAQALQVTGREINQLMRSWNVDRPIKEYVVNRAKAEVKWEIRKRFALDFISGHMELMEAAEGAGVSDRQMRRWVSELLNKHFQMPWGDLRELDSAKRARLAEEIEKAENLELERQQTLNSIAKGKKTLESEALDRVISRKKRKTM